MDCEEKKYYLAFSAFEEGIGPVRFKRLLEHFQTAKDAYFAAKDQLKEIIPANIADKFVLFRQKFNLELYLKELSRKEIAYITIEDSNYPYLLKQISDPPFVLYLKGTLPAEDAPWFGVVGTRQMTNYGRAVTEKLTADLVKNGFVIVSGLARGVDTVAHKTAINNKGKTIAVLGCGVDVIYPPENRELYYQIMKNGCVVSEMPPGLWAAKGTFPARNRIISGLSKGVLMTEGTEKSGALITCSYAADQGRDVFSVPGPVNSVQSTGTLGILKKGAKLVTDINDILEEIQ